MKKYIIAMVITLSLSEESYASNTQDAPVRTWRKSISDMLTVKESAKSQAKGLVAICAALYYVNNSAVLATDTLARMPRISYLDFDDLRFLGKRVLLIGAILYAARASYLYATEKFEEAFANNREATCPSAQAQAA